MNLSEEYQVKTNKDLFDVPNLDSYEILKFENSTMSLNASFLTVIDEDKINEDNFTQTIKIPQPNLCKPPLPVNLE